MQSETVLGSRPNPAPFRKATSPAVKTTIKDEGTVVRHDVSWFGLHVMVVAVNGKYPDLEVWMEMVNGDVVLHHYSEKIVANVFTGYLWLFWNEE